MNSRFTGLSRVRASDLGVLSWAKISSISLLVSLSACRVFSLSIISRLLVSGKEVGGGVIIRTFPSRG